MREEWQGRRCAIPATGGSGVSNRRAWGLGMNGQTAKTARVAGGPMRDGRTTAGQAHGFLNSLQSVLLQLHHYRAVVILVTKQPFLTPTSLYLYGPSLPLSGSTLTTRI